MKSEVDFNRVKTENHAITDDRQWWQLLDCGNRDSFKHLAIEESLEVNQAYRDAEHVVPGLRQRLFNEVIDHKTGQDWIQR